MRHPSFVRPEYGSRCFADIPQTIRHLLTQEGQPGLSPSLLGEHLRGVRKIVCFFLDAFGWRFVQERMERYALLQEVAAQGRALQLTSQFPSTTAAHMTAFHSGLPPIASGVFEWQYYEPTLDRLICPLPFSFAGDKVPNTLCKAGVKAEGILPTSDFYLELHKQGVSSTAYVPIEYVNSSYSKRIMRGATRRPIRTLAEGLTNLSEELLNADGPTYINFYHANIDSICHRYGPQSPHVDAEIDAVLTQIERLFLRKVQGKSKDTLLLVTADHGQVEVSPETTIYLNEDARFASLEGMLKRNKAGEPLVPGGSCRDMFLYIEEEALDDAVACLQGPLEGVADVVKTQTLLDEGYFGDGPASDVFLSRVGNLVILPYKGESVWWYKEGKFEQKKWGHHGGLTREEMEIPLLLLDLGS